MNYIFWGVDFGGLFCGNDKRFVGCSFDYHNFVANKLRCGRARDEIKYLEDIISKKLFCRVFCTSDKTIFFL